MAALLPWQQQSWRQLLAYPASGRVPQAILFSGPAGVGKLRLADAYARALLCTAPAADAAACGDCASCRLAAAETHPDLLRLVPDEPGKAIGVEQIRRLLAVAALKPQYPGWRVVLLYPADALNAAAANAFLKLLEEPGERTCFLLLSEQPGRLPATIRSRCQKLSCRLPAAAMATAWLTAQGVAGDGGLLLRLAGGAPLRALDYAGQDLPGARATCFQSWLAVAQGHSGPLPVAEQWCKQPLPAAAMLLDWQIGWITDIIKLGLGAGGQLANPDLAAELAVLAAKLPQPGLFRHYDMLLEQKRLLGGQLNRQLQLEQSLIDWSGLHAGPT